MEPAGGDQHDDKVKRLLDQARSAIQASNAAQALQCVIEALKLVRGDNAVIPTLRHAAEQYHAQRAAPIHEISALLAQVSLQAGQRQQDQQVPLHLQQPTMQQHPQQQCQQQYGQHQQAHYQQQQQQQQEAPGPDYCQDSAAILHETGRGKLTSYALADGSSWQCPWCAGVVPVQRKQAHLQAWCPQLPQQHSNGSVGDDDMAQ